MGSIDEYLKESNKPKKTKKKFEKTNYRPWDYDTNKQDTTITPEKKDKWTVTKKILKNIDMYHGHQKKILLYLCGTANKENTSKYLTPPITINQIQENTKIEKQEVIYSSLTRLKRKNALKTHFNKPGKGGFAIYTINNSFFEEEDNV